MNKIYNIMAVMGLTMVLAACSDIVDLGDGTDKSQIANQGVPVISHVYKVADADLTTPITSEEIGKMVRIEGENLNFPQSITFNTVPVDLSEVYTFSTGANVPIPAVATAARLNKLEYTTDMGTATYDFTATYPELTLSLQNAFSAPGTEVTILGKYLTAYDFGNTGTISINGNALTIGEYTSDYVKAMIPEATPDNSTITVSYNNVSGDQETVYLHYRPTNNAIMDCKNVGGGDELTATSVYDLDLKGYEMHVSGNTTKSWSWNRFTVTNTMPLDNITPLSDYVVQFEVRTKNGTSFIASSKEAPLFKFMLNQDDQSKCAAWIPGDGEGLDTNGEWQTVSLPLSDMAPNGVAKMGDNQSLYIIMNPSTECAVDFDMANFRIDKKVQERDIPTPDLVVTGLQSEFPVAGGTAVILGSGFNCHKNDVHASMDNHLLIARSYKRDRLELEIPENAEDNKTIEFTYTDKTGTHTVTYPFRPTKGLLFGDYADATVSNNDGTLVPSVVSDGADNTPVTGYKAVHVKGSTAAWGWNTIQLKQDFAPATITNPTNCVLKFEVLTPEASPLPADTEDDPIFRIGIGWDEPRQAVRSIGNTHGEWKTVTVPLDNIATRTNLVHGNETLWYFLIKPCVAWDADFYMSNFRVEGESSEESGTSTVPVGTEQQGGTDAGHITPAGAKKSRM